MYLADKDIRAVLPEMDLHCPVEEHPFDAESQIQPCSIDLRVSNVFWEPSRRRKLARRLMPWRKHTIDLRRAQIQELDPLRDWRTRTLTEGEFVTIPPGRVVMGRIYERFRIPSGYAGKIEGRSSFARMGLAVHCTGDFINPGWHGFMPLQLFNAGPYPLRLPPFFPVCQLMLVKLSSESERPYGDPELESKYVNDDGGPSLWWRDARVRALQRRLGEKHVGEAMQQAIVERVRFESPDVLERFQTFVNRRRVEQLENADALLQDFADREDHLRLFDTIVKWLSAALGATSLGSALAAEIGTFHYVIWAATILILPIAAIAYVRREGGYLGTPELRETGNRPVRAP